ncbi:response regulator [Pseudoalteromonas phenolica]|uniref:response regulator n=1 Tax=Pseudoalteromonas phenolica TaxID=161398 RepID=UPI00110BF1DB|nr:response regulator [Pseudoalteromonas phenolica]TMO56655.1 response regulator [Pseudoalteromonas phenolica]
MHNTVDHAQRRPKVIVVCDSPTELAGVTEILSSQVSEYRTLTTHKDIEEVILKTQPSIIILARETVAKSVESYRLLAQSELLNYPHENILLCENKESGVAFRCCIKGIFTDYFIYKPMYENYRFKMILHNALNRTSDVNEVHKLREEHFGRIDENLKALIDDAANYHNKASDTLNSARESLDNHKGINQVQDQLLTELKNTHLAPLIDSLESQLKDSIDELQSRLKDKRFSIAELAAMLSEKDGAVSVQNVKNEQEQNPKDHNKVNSSEPQSQTPNAKVEKSDIKVMVVEDNEFYREMVSRVLIDEGYKVISVGTGLEAIKLLKKQKFSVVLLDLFMPELDGYNTTKNLRNIPHCKQLPIIAISGNKNKDIIRKWATLGLTGYITKPCTKSSLLKAVEKAINQ